MQQRFAACALRRCCTGSSTTATSAERFEAVVATLSRAPLQGDETHIACTSAAGRLLGCASCRKGKCSG
eukprot:6413038-Alexandrium_andersonii.AAC.2